MTIKFIIYEKTTGVIYFADDKLPENDFINECSVSSKRIRMNGIKWLSMDWELFEEAVEVNFKPLITKYDPITKEISEE